MKKLFLFASLMVSAMASYAQDFTATIAVEDFAIEAPGTAQVNFVLAEGGPLMDAALYVQTPEGLKITKLEAGEGYDGRGSLSINVVDAGEDGWQLSAFNTASEGAYEAGKTMWVVTFEAEEGFAGGECTLSTGPDGGGMNEDWEECDFAEVKFNVTVGGALPTTFAVDIKDGKGTLVADAALDFTDSGINAYVVKEVTAAKYVVYEQVFQVPAGTPIVVEGESGEVAIIESAEAPAVNLLAAGDGKTHQGDYALASTGKWKKLPATMVIPEGKAYLPASAIPAAAKGAEFLDVLGDATAIESINAEQSNAPMYNLNGVRVFNAQKGVYIQNGRKVIIK